MQHLPQTVLGQYLFSLFVWLFFLMKRRKKIPPIPNLTGHNLKAYLVEHLSYSSMQHMLLPLDCSHETHLSTLSSGPPFSLTFLTFHIIRYVLLEMLL